ncbi:MAG TPA: glycoside hydrolase family 32 protein [Chthonomonadales bacterium]|nr:glycoside hydrolase family 32 protein [Chthonomonadales bacterium]
MVLTLVTLATLLAFAPAALPARPDIVVADFEGDDWGGWTATGEAVGTGPAQGTLPNQMAVTGFLGLGLVNTFRGGDGTTGTLRSPEFRIERRFLSFLLGGGMDAERLAIRLLVDGRAVRSATGPNDRPGGTERLEWASWDVADLQGRTARIEIVDQATGGWGHINVDHIVLSDERVMEEIVAAPLYAETYRPQFHFTAARNWLNDPVGLVFYRGEYHLFFQHNPFGNEWGNMTWGHAVSRDLVRWEQLPNALEPDAMGTMFSGSAVVDRHNTAGFATGRETALVAIYTAAGGTSPESQGVPFTQCIAWSVDRGRTWTKYAGNPVLGHIVGGNRDPKVVWHAPTRRWIMALYLDGEEFALFASPDLKAWTLLHRLTMPGSTECPDFFEMPVQGEPGETRWVFTGANGRYFVGRFDGHRFEPETGPHAGDYGANFYAVQTFSDIPPRDGRRIQIAWMNGGAYPRMPFNQQMSFPCELTLHRTPEGLRLRRWPVREIRTLYGPAIRKRGLRLAPGAPVAIGEGELWDVEAEFEPRGATEVGILVRGEAIRYRPAEAQVACLGRTGPLPLRNGRVRLRALVDRASIEVFGNGGELSMTSWFLPRQKQRGLSVYAKGGEARLVSLVARPLRSAWERAAPARTGR